MSFRSFVIAAACATLPCIAVAGPLSVQLLPAGMCALDAKIPAQATILTYLNASNAAGNELVTGFASCDELKAIADKKATSVSHYGSVLKQPVVADLTMDRPTYLATVATTFNAHPELLQAALGSVGGLAAQGADASGVSAPDKVGATSKGVLYQDPRIVIIGMEQTNSIDGKATKVASTTGMTMVGGAPVSVNLYAPLADKNAFAAATEALKPTINRMIRDNQ